MRLAQSELRDGPVGGQVSLQALLHYTNRFHKTTVSLSQQMFGNYLLLQKISRVASHGGEGAEEKERG